MGGKLLSIQVPFLFKGIADDLEMRVRGRAGSVESRDGDNAPPEDAIASAAAIGAAIPLALLLSYGLARATAAGFTELRNSVFARVAQRAIRLVSRDVYRHLFALDHRYHLERQTGALQRVLERGSRSINFVLTSLVFNVVPTALEILLVTGIFASQCGAEYAAVSLATLAGYVAYTVKVTVWRTDIRKNMNRLEATAANIAVDGLLNYEAVKAFGNEEVEIARYDEALTRVDAEALRIQSSLSALNFGQSVIFSAGLTAAMALAARDITNGSMSLGDLILVNGLLFQLSIPLNFVGMVYRELRQGLTDMDAMFKVLDTQPRVREVSGAPDLSFIQLQAATPPIEERPPPARPVAFDARDAVRFENVHFGYIPGRDVLKGLSFSLPHGATVGVVGSSGCGKSTVGRLLFRYYDVDSGTVRVYGQDVRGVTLASLRSALCTVPQDTTLFNATVHDNIAYGVLGGSATRAAVASAARTAALDESIASWPAGYETLVGERGLKLSGGEKQRVALARAVLKDAPILLCDEATASLDTSTELAVMTSLRAIAAGRSTLLIAHRLSSVMHADKILVLHDGRLAEEGSHSALLAQRGVYARLWDSQSRLHDAEEAAKRAAATLRVAVEENSKLK